LWYNARIIIAQIIDEMASSGYTDLGMRPDRVTTNRVILLIAVAIVLAVMVLVGSVRLLPPPPGPPTPTAPYVLNRPEGLPRIAH
jgi:hypothetical protein